MDDGEQVLLGSNHLSFSLSIFQGQGASTVEKVPLKIVAPSHPTIPDKPPPSPVASPWHLS